MTVPDDAVWAAVRGDPRRGEVVGFGQLVQALEALFRGPEKEGEDT